MRDDYWSMTLAEFRKRNPSWQIILPRRGTTGSAFAGISSEQRCVLDVHNNVVYGGYLNERWARTTADWVVQETHILEEFRNADRIQDLLEKERILLGSSLPKVSVEYLPIPERYRFAFTAPRGIGDGEFTTVQTLSLDISKQEISLLLRGELFSRISREYHAECIKNAPRIYYRAPFPADAPENGKSLNYRRVLHAIEQWQTSLSGYFCGAEWPYEYIPR